MERASNVDDYIAGAGGWQESLIMLRQILQSTGLKETVKAQEGTTKGLRQWRFTSAREIKDQKETILAYLREAVHNQEQGMEIRPDRNKALEIPKELELAFSKDPALKDSFDAQSPYRKREETRQKRLELIIPMILGGIGLGDKYRK